MPCRRRAQRRRLLLAAGLSSLALALAAPRHAWAQG
jgi:hypothetical protein